MGIHKSWKEKLYNGNEPKIVRVERAYAGLPAGSTLLVGTPLLVKQYIDAIPEGQTVDVSTMRRDLAARFGADAMCPSSTGIFVRIVREAANEDRAAGRPSTPIERLTINSPPKRTDSAMGRPGR